ncbi:hypothetical protein [Terrarubrum flagellatum]|uniref:hypothetical protein n=1 Tax=Terrirubrum flagellatum TaxID=2895980 RepID=UPI003144ED56
MAEAQILMTLTAKRNELEAIIDQYEKRLHAARTDLAHVNATLRLFRTKGEPTEFPVPVGLNRIFRRGEAFGLCLEALRQAPDGLDTRELSLAIIKAKGWDDADRVLRMSVSAMIVGVLGQRAKRGQLRVAGKRKGVVIWALNP